MRLVDELFAEPFKSRSAANCAACERRKSPISGAQVKLSSSLQSSCASASASAYASSLDSPLNECRLFVGLSSASWLLARRL